MTPGLPSGNTIDYQAVMMVTYYLAVKTPLQTASVAEQHNTVNRVALHAAEQYRQK
jgi:hypothetical protein